VLQCGAPPRAERTGFMAWIQGRVAKPIHSLGDPCSPRRCQLGCPRRPPDAANIAWSYSDPLTEPLHRTGLVDVCFKSLGSTERSRPSAPPM
jgi:hypothetical protein